MLSSKDYKKILEIIDIAYSLPDRAEMFRTVCEQLQKLVPIASAAFISANRKTKTFEVHGSLVFNAPFKPMHLFASHYAALHPYIAATAGEREKHLNKVVRLTDIVPASRLPQTEYGCDFQSLVPILYELCAWPGSQGDLVGGMGLHRQKDDRDFTDKDKEIISLCMPHLSRALHLVELRRETPDPAVGVIVIGADGRLRYMNAEAKRALGEWPISAIPDPGLGASPTFLHTRRGRYRVLTARDRTGERETTVLLEPLPSAEWIRSQLCAFGLTKRQQEISVLVIRGCSNGEIAERLFICEQTVKDHLHDIFDEVQVRSRSELIAKVLGLRESGTGR